MSQENQSSRSGGKTDLEKKIDRLEKTLEMVKKTIDHDQQMKLKKPMEFGKYEML